MKRTTIRIIRYLLASLLFLLIPSVACAEDDSTHSFFSGFYVDSYLKYFVNQQDVLQDERYLTEGAIDLQYIIYSRNKSFFYLWEIFLMTGMGDSVSQNLPFSPIETTYLLSPLFLEYRREGYIYRTGWEHACHHIIYKDLDDPWYEREEVDVAPDVYYNRLYFGLGTPEIRRSEQVGTFLNKKRKRPAVIWYTEIGHYLRSFFGQINEETLYGHNNWEWDWLLTLRVPLYSASSFAIFANSDTQLLQDTEGDAYWRECVQLEAVFSGEAYSSSVFVGMQVVDEHPRDSKEDLVEIGARFFF